MGGSSHEVAVLRAAVCKMAGFSHGMAVFRGPV